IVTTEFNIEGYPSKEFIDLVCEVCPTQVTLVPDPPEALTSNNGWDTIKYADFLKEVVAKFKACGIRVSIFVNPDPEMVAHAVDCGTDRVELYTESYARGYDEDREAAIAPYVAAAEEARRQGLGLNAGHDLNLDNLQYFDQTIPWLDEVSIGHALICDALYLGMENTVRMYLNRLK
ncbi:MAG: pyridoxine 5'-phosphate synthase, partial [Rikenellaceae bacterium]|nr:pyridoxine 5'-phosphate synthase [Rikenellaceae bacterium]